MCEASAALIALRRLNDRALDYVMGHAAAIADEQDESLSGVAADVALAAAQVARERAAARLVSSLARQQNEAYELARAYSQSP